MRILLIEDDEILSDVLVKALEQQRYVVDTVDDGRFGLEYAEGGVYDLLLVDVGLPRLDGISLCQQLRNSGYSTPILLMTAHDAPDEKIRGLDAGADDYLTKPFNIEELQARLRALIRRGEVSPTTVLEMGQLQLDPVSCEVTYADTPLKLTPKEYSLLELFLRNPTRVFSRGQIIEHLWTFDDPPLEDSVKAHVKGLRRRLKKAGAGGWIENVYGLGYKLSPKIDYEAIAQQNATDTQAIQPHTAPAEPAAASVEQTSVEKQFDQAMDALWQQHYTTMRDRLTCLQTAERALQQGSLPDDLRQSASQAAHKLAGVLGMFGKDEGTQVARELESLLSQPESSAGAIAPPLQQLTAILNLPAELPAEFPGNPPIASKATLDPAPPPVGPHSSATSLPRVPASPIKILAIDDDPILLASLPPLLEPWGMSVTTLSDPTQFWDTLSAATPDLLILDIEMPHRSGIDLCQSVRNDPRDDGKWQSLPILFLTARQNAAGQVFAVGADDYVVKPVLGPELITRITNRIERTQFLKTLWSRDPQTGLANQAQSQRDLQQLIQTEKSFTFALLKLVNLAQINLAYGHSTGHQVLKAWGDELTTRLPHALLGYWGNGDFVIGLPAVTLTAASDALQTVQKAFRQRVFTASPPDSEKVSTNTRFQAQYAIALSAFPEDRNTLVGLYQSAYSQLTLS
ncbi:MAG: response regulator [Phormidesmis sp.]